ncbi:N-succinylarginine dihydrolase [Pirellulaceae bacterium SH449]
MDREFVEINVDGMIGPSHHFGGLGVENKASEQNRSSCSSPKRAALQGLSKMEIVASYGIPQFYLPPPSRPVWRWLASLGFTGTQAQIIAQCQKEFPLLLSAAYSSAFMWTANAASMACGSDTQSGRMLLKLANLNANLHRSIEESDRFPQLIRMFAGVENTGVLSGLFSSRPLSDEGAANIMRFCSPSGAKGVYAFVFGEVQNSSTASTTTNNRRPRQPRQTRLASELVARSLELDPLDYVFAQQTPEAIDAGVFHNDVIATSHENLLLYHEDALVGSERVVEQLKSRFRSKTGGELETFRVADSDLPLGEAVDTYLFNSQIVTDRDGNWRLIAPENCGQSTAVQRVIKQIQAAHPRLKSVDYVPLAESMRNGGGPACLRLRIHLSPEQIAQIPATMRISPAILDQLRQLVESEYPDELHASDFANPDFAEHCIRISLQIDQLWGANSGVSR